MDLQSCLAPGDLFVSYWLDRSLTVVSGDQTDVLSVEHADATGLRDLLHDFERHVTRADHYTAFLSEERRPGSWPAPVATISGFHKLSLMLASRLVTPKVRELVSSGRYRRLLLFPDGILNALPLERLICPGAFASPGLAGGIVYAPSASAYVYACERRRREQLRYALILAGDREDKLLVREAQQVANCLPCRSDVVCTMAELQRQTDKADLIYVATHGAAPDSSDTGRGWSILFDGAALGAEDFYQERIRLARSAVVVLSACSVGRLTAGPAHELDGLIHALFYGGASAVLAARWPVLYEAAEAVFLGAINSAFRGPVSLSAAFHGAIAEAEQRKDIRGYMGSPEAALFFLGAFALFGCGD